MSRIGAVVLVLVVARVGAMASAGIDVQIVSVTQTVPLPGPIVGVPIPVVLRLVNVGDQSAGPFRVSIWKNLAVAPTNSAGADDSKLISSLAPGEGNSLAVTFEVTYDSPGTYTLQVWADAGSQIGDTDEANNRYTILLTVVENLPDLLIENIVLDTDRPGTGEPFNVIVTIRNQGLVGAGSFHMGLWKDRLAPPSAGNADAAVAVEAIPAGEIGTATCSVTYDSVGTYKLWLLVDANSEIAEINEDNNASYIEVPVHSSNAVPNSLRAACGSQGVQDLLIFGMLSSLGLLCMRRFVGSR